MPVTDPAQYINKPLLGIVTQAWDNGSGKHKYLVEFEEPYDWEGMRLTPDRFGRASAEELVGVRVEFCPEVVAREKKKTFIGKMRVLDAPQEKQQSQPEPEPEPQDTPEPSVPDNASVGDLLIAAARFLKLAGDKYNETPF